MLSNSDEQLCLDTVQDRWEIDERNRRSIERVQHNPHNFFRMIPRFQVVDRQFILVSDSTRHRPRHNPSMELAPALGQLRGGG